MNFKNLFYTKEERKVGEFTKKTTKFLCFKFARYIPKMDDVIDEFQYKYFYRQNANLVFVIYHTLLEKAKEDDLFCLHTRRVSFIFNKKVLDFGYKNFHDYVLNCFRRKDLFEFVQLDKNSVLYKYHYPRLKNNEFLWKYRNQDGIILHQFISFDEQGFYVNDVVWNTDKTILESDDGNYFTIKNARRPFYQGVTVREYLEDKDYETQKNVLIKLAEWIFQNYTIENGMIDRKLCDCHWGNFIYDASGQFHFIDDDLCAPEPLTKDYVIKKILMGADRPELVNDLLVHFGFEPLTTKKKKSEFSEIEQLKKEIFISKYS